MSIVQFNPRCQKERERKREGDEEVEGEGEREVNCLSQKQVEMGWKMEEKQMIDDIGVRVGALVKDGVHCMTDTNNKQFFNHGA